MKEITVTVIDNDVERALRILKKKIQNDGLFKRLKVKKYFEKHITLSLNKKEQKKAASKE